VDTEDGEEHEKHRDGEEVENNAGTEGTQEEDSDNESEGFPDFEEEDILGTEGNRYTVSCQTFGRVLLLLIGD
jgi:hypothetical protein